MLPPEVFVLKVVVIVSALASSAVLAADPPAGPPPAPELAAELKVFDGKWRCEGSTPDTAYTKAHPLKADMSWKRDLNGHWHVMRYDEKKTKENPTPYVMTAFCGFDAQRKVLVRTDIDGLGMVTHLTSKGWQGNVLVWSGETGGAQKVAFKETVTQRSPAELTSVLEMADGKGAFLVIGESTCKKVAGAAGAAAPSAAP